MKTLRYGILSTASIVPRFIKGVQSSTNGEVVALASRNYAKAKEMVSQQDIKKAYGDYEALFQDEEVDIVYIATPNYLHYEHCMRALKAGKHVVCEKPFMLTKKEALEVFTFAQEQSLFIMEAQKSVFLPVNNWLKKAIVNKLIGNISFVRLSSYYPAGDDKEHWMYSHKKGGGVFYGSGSYTIEYMRYLFDKPIISSQGSAIVAPTGVDALGTINLNINNEHLITTTISCLAPIEAEAIFYGDKGKIIVPHYWRPQQAKVLYNDKVVEDIQFPFESEFVYEINHINECINNGLLESPIMNKQVTLECIEIIEGIVEKKYQ